MSNKISIRFYNDHMVRAVWNDTDSKWYFSIVDIVAAITDSPRPRVYWGTVKSRQKAQHGELYSKCIQLKLLAADGKRYATDCFAQEDIAEVVKTLPAKNTDIRRLLRGALTNKINDRELFLKGIDYSYYYEQE